MVRELYLYGDGWELVDRTRTTSTFPSSGLYLECGLAARLPSRHPGVPLFSTSWAPTTTARRRAAGRGSGRMPVMNVRVAEDTGRRRLLQGERHGRFEQPAEHQDTRCRCSSVIPASTRLEAWSWISDGSASASDVGSAEPQPAGPGGRSPDAGDAAGRPRGPPGAGRPLQGNGRHADGSPDQGRVRLQLSEVHRVARRGGGRHGANPDLRAGHRPGRPPAGRAFRSNGPERPIEVATVGEDGHRVPLPTALRRPIRWSRGCRPYCAAAGTAGADHERHPASSPPGVG